MVVLCTTRGPRGLPTSKVDLYAAIHRDSRAGLPNRTHQRKYGVGFLTVKKALIHRPHRSPLPGVGVPDFDRQRGHLAQALVVLGRAALVIDRRQDLLNGR